ncbi:hypothetical protein ABZP36_015345 [Zizania latifolia]
MQSIDILRDVHAAKECGKPYVIVFVGLNGVGKSIDLAKVAYWLLQHNLSVMLAACDTFRSGDVEQLPTHARRLQIYDDGERGRKLRRHGRLAAATASMARSGEVAGGQERRWRRGAGTAKA